MIFVTVGMHTSGFERLIREMDRISSEINEPVIMQIGSSAYEPQHADFFRFASFDRMQQLCCEARLVVCQAATSIITALEQGTCVIAVPRQHRYREHIDDHQVEFADALSNLIGIRVVKDINTLQESIMDKAEQITFQPGVHKKEFIAIVKRHVQEISCRRP